VKDDLEEVEGVVGSGGKEGWGGGIGRVESEGLVSRDSTKGFSFRIEWRRGVSSRTLSIDVRRYQISIGS
jgi:hypothetical protein